MEENDITLKYKDGVRLITINRPNRKNAVSSNMYQTITRVLNEDSENDDIVVSIITGSGNYFTSGNDLKGVVSEESSVTEAVDKVKSMVSAFINYPKLLIAVVNGPAIGIGATMAALCDIVYASDRAVFDTPFVQLGLCAEAASSFTFPYNMGRSKASEMLLLGHKLTAKEAYQFGFISSVIPHASLDMFINDLQKFGKLPVKTLKLNKKLIMSNLKSHFHECNDREIEQVLHCVESEEFGNAVARFLSKKSKL